MRRHAIGVAGGVLAFLGSALAVQAQGIGIQGTHPTAVYHTDSQSTYQATVTYTGSFKWRLKVLYDGVEKWPGTQYQVSSPGPSVTVSETVTGMNTWGMVATHWLDYRGKAWVTMSITDTDDLMVQVEQGTSKLMPTPKPVPFGDPDREVLLADVVRREEKEWA